MKVQSLRVLMVDDSEDDVQLIIRELKKGGYNPIYERVETAAAMKKALHEKQWDIILCDYKMPNFNALSAIAVLKETKTDIPLIIISGAIGEETAVECMRLGAHDYFMKGKLSLLCSAIARELEEAEIKNRQKQAESQREAALNALRENEELYTKLVDAIPDIIVHSDLEGKILFVNDYALQISGYSREEVEGLNMLMFFPSEEHERLIQETSLMLERRLGPREYNLLAKDGRKIPLEINGDVLRNEDGTPFGVVTVSRDISERKRTERMLRENEERFRGIAKNLPGIIYQFYAKNSGEYGISYVSEHLMKYLGITANLDDMFPLFLSHVHEEDRDRYLTSIQKAVETGTSWNFEGRVFVMTSGEMIWFQCMATPTRHEDRLVFDGILLDITERKQAEFHREAALEALHQSEEKYRSILENIQEGYFEVDLAGNFTFFNDAMYRLYGYSREELKGINYRQYTDKENAKILFQTFNKIYNTGEPVKELNWQVIRKDGAKRYVEASASLQKDPSGKPTGFKGIIHDITERKQAEQELQESEKYFKEITENSSDIIILTDRKGKIKYCSRSIERFTGYKPEELIGRNGLSLIHPDDVKRAAADYGKAVLTTDSAIPNSFRILHKDGSECHFEGLGRNLLNNPAVAGFIMNVRDVTERKKTEEKLLLTLESLRKAFGTTIQVMVSAVEMKDPYTAGHQLRTADLARSIAKEMGLSQEQIDGIRMAGSIHDIGKLSIPSEILSKPTKLTNIEFTLIKEHSQSGYEMLKNVESPWPLAQIVYQHHERMNGSGYPRNLKGDEILLEARIMAVADVVEAMASHRPYRAALGIEVALEEIEKNKGIFYDKAVADACLRLFREKGYKFP